MQDIHRKVVEHILRRRKSRRGAPYNPIKLLDKLIKYCNSESIKTDLINLKISEARMLDLHDEVYRSVILYLSLHPTRPEPWFQLVTYYRDDSVDLGKAVLASCIAVSVAKLDGNFVRQALGERMRTLLIANEINAANNCLEELIRFKPEKRALDVNYESDFLKYPSASRLDEELIAAYKNLAA